MKDKRRPIAIADGQNVELEGWDIATYRTLTSSSDQIQPATKQTTTHFRLFNLESNLSYSIAIVRSFRLTSMLEIYPHS